MLERLGEEILMFFERMCQAYMRSSQALVGNYGGHVEDPL